MTNPRAELRAAVVDAVAYLKGATVGVLPDGTPYMVAPWEVTNPNGYKVRLATKSVNEVLREYEAALTSFAYEVLRGGDAVDFRRSHKALIRSLAEQAYTEGLREGGVAADEMDDDDTAAIRAWVSEQVAHVNDFAAWLVGGEPRNSEEKRRELETRIGFWVESLEQLGNAGRAASLGNPMLEMVGEDGAENCDDCREHKGKRMRRKTWQARGLVPGVIGNSNYACGGWLCRHYLADKDGNRVLP